MTCECQSTTTELDQAVERVVAAAVDRLTPRLDALDALVASVAPVTETDPAKEPIEAAVSDVAESRMRDFETRITQVEEALSAIIVDMTPTIQDMEN